VKPFEKRGFQRRSSFIKHDGPFGTAALSAHHDTVRRAMRANPSRDRAAGHAPRVSSTATRRLGSRVPPPARAAQRRASPRDVVVRPRARRAQPPTRWVEAPRRRPRAQSLSFVPEGDAAPPRSALVVGAGPAGALAALYLSRLGWRVRVLDAMPGNERTNENAVVSRRGLAALRDAGVVLDPERDGATTLEGAVVHRRVPNTPNSAIGHATNQFKGSVVLPRGALVDAIARSIRSSDESSVSRENTSSAAVTFEYGKSLRFVDLDNRVAFFDDVSTQCSTNDVFVEVTYDVLVGADGAESVVRGTLEREGVLKCERNADGLFAKTFVLPPGFYHESETSRDGWHRRRHSWPSGLVDAFATPNADGSFDLTIVAPIGFWRSVRDASDAEALLQSYVPNAFDDIVDVTTDAYKSNAIEVLLNPNASHPNGVSTFCSRLTAFDGSVVLVGDAAHSAWPTLGQNTDATLETSAYLGAALERAMAFASGGVLGGKEDDGGDENNFDVKTALVTYFERGRAPAARAYVRLCETGFGSGDVGWKRRVENFFFFAKLFVVTCLHRLLPFLFDAPALSKMDDPSWGYDDVEDETRRESGTVFGVFFSLITLVVATRRFGLKKVVESLVTTGRALLTGDANGGEGVVIVVLGFVALVTAAFRFAEKRRARKRETRRGNATRRETRVA